MKVKRTILCLDPNEQSLSIRRLMLETRGYRVAGFACPLQAWERFREGGIDLVLNHLHPGVFEEHDLVERIKSVSPATPAITLYNPQRPPASSTSADFLIAEGAITPAALLEEINLLLQRRKLPRSTAPRENNLTSKAC